MFMLLLMRHVIVWVRYTRQLYYTSECSYCIVSITAILFIQAYINEIYYLYKELYTGFLRLDGTKNLLPSRLATGRLSERRSTSGAIDTLP